MLELGKSVEADFDIAKLHDRAADNWRPLLAIADLAKGDWPVVARNAAIGLADTDEEVSLGQLCLSDVEAAFFGAWSPSGFSERPTFWSFRVRASNST